MKYTFLYLLVSLVVISCETITSDSGLEATETKNVPKGNTSNTKIESDTNNLQVKQETTFNFKEFAITFDRILSHPNNGENITEDTTIVHLEVGEDIETSTLRFSNTEEYRYSIETCFENSLYLTNLEDKTCELFDWIHFTSPWKKLKETDGTYTFTGYRDSELSKKFPKISMDSLKNEVEKKCAADFLSPEQKLTSIYHTPCSITITKYKFRIKATHKASNTSLEKYFFFIPSFGC